MKAIVAAFVAFGLAAPASALVSNGGFETDETVSGFPTTAGDWGQDLATIVMAENGITPRSGSQMLRFDSTSNTSPGSGRGSDVAQLIDLTSLSGTVAAGSSFSASAYFNRVAGDASTDTEFGIALRAYNGALSSFSDPTFSGNPLAQSMNSLFSDANPASWEMLSTALVLPTNTTFVTLTITARENIADDLPEFDGHYADDVSANLTPVPEPATYALFLGGLGLLVLARGRRG